MDARQRRSRILGALSEASGPLSGSSLAAEVGVSRQVIVQDIALLRAQGAEIVSTNRGYVLQYHPFERLFKVQHTPAETADELQTIVDAGGTVEDVMVNHRVYGKISAPLHIASRRDIEKFMDDIRSGRSSLLLTVTSGYHFHHVIAQSAEALDDIAQALADKGYLAEFLPYEQQGI